MKQKKFGKKIQNWHRPLGPSQIGHRFRQLRYESIEPSVDLMVSDYFEEDDWNPYDPDDDYELERQKNLFAYSLYQLLQDIIESSPSILIPERTKDIQSEADVANAVASFTRQRPMPRIEERLAAHVDMLTHVSSKDVADALNPSG